MSERPRHIHTVPPPPVGAARIDCSACVRREAALEAAERRAEEAEQALRTGRDLVEAMDRLMTDEAVSDKDGWIVNYRIPTGPWHRLLGWARGRALSHNQPSSSGEVKDERA